MIGMYRCWPLLLHRDREVHGGMYRAGDVIGASGAERDVFRRSGANHHPGTLQFGGASSIGITRAVLADTEIMGTAAILRVDNVQRLTTAQRDTALHEGR